MTPKEEMKIGDALLVVDVQNDFCPGGALPIEQGDSIIPVVNDWIQTAEEIGPVICASKGWHPRQHLSFMDIDAPCDDGRSGETGS